MAQYARGKYALGICDRTGFRYPLSELVYETVNGKRTGFRVGRDVADADHPQNFLGRLRIVDPRSLRDPRPETDRAQITGLFGWNPVGHPEVFLTAVAGTAIAGEDPDFFKDWFLFSGVIKLDGQWDDRVSWNF